MLGCLIEKEITTPEYYPLTLNALRAACNQKSNRDPVMALDEATLDDALDELRYRKHLVWQVSVSGSRASKFKHRLPDALPFTEKERALVVELLLRGPQTVGELRTHAKRLYPFESVPEVEDVIRGLMHWEGRELIRKLPPPPGRREPRYTHLLCGETEGAGDDGGAPAREPEPDGALPMTETPSPTDVVADLARLRDEFDALRAEFDALKASLGET